MFCALRSHVYKIIRTPIWAGMIVWPVLAVGLFVAYYSVAAWSQEQKWVAYFQVISLGMSGLTTLLCSYVAQQERRAGDSFNMLCVGRSRLRTFLSLFLLLLSLTSFGIILSSVGFYLFWGWGKIPAGYYILASFLMLMPLACLIFIQMFIAFRFGVSWAVSTGAVFLLIGALGITGLFDRFWYYLPPVWAVRFASLVIASFFHHEYIIEITDELRRGIFFCLLFSIVIALLVSRWFHKWDGHPSHGDE